MVEVAKIRTLLFVPANRPDRFANAADSGADAIILDLEDAVPADAKDIARAALDLDFTDLPVFIRINAIDTSSYEADIAAVRALRPAAILLPKAEEPNRIAALCTQLENVPVIGLIETALGLAAARQIAKVPGIIRLAFGSIDFCADLSCEHRRDVLLPVRSELVIASRLAGISAPIDGVTVQLDDISICEDDAAHGRSLGMSGKLCIHPKQIEAVRLGFAPSNTEIEWARRVVASGGGAVSVDGAMVDEPVRIHARSLLAQIA